MLIGEPIKLKKDKKVDEAGLEIICIGNKVMNRVLL